MVKKLLFTVFLSFAALAAPASGQPCPVTVAWNFTVTPTQCDLAVGATLTFSGDFLVRPLQITDATFTTSGATLANSGSSFSYTFNAAGTYFFRSAFQPTTQFKLIVGGSSCTPALVPNKLDIDADGTVNAATDGLLVTRYMLGIRGSALTNGAISQCPGRTPADIELLLQNLTTQR